MPRQLLLVLALTVAPGCGALASSPGWAGGGLAVSGPLRTANEEALETAERAKVASQPQQVSARHVLVMHQGSRAKPENVVRTREEARARAQECLRKLREGADFAKMVEQYSDEPGAAERGGDLGAFGREVMVKAFTDAAFNLRVNEISEVIETPYGFHVIQRTK
jgi:peptidyl-prolyl cis-trans isomerase NIMA-interacting 1